MQKTLFLILYILCAHGFAASAQDPVKLSATHGYVYVQLPKGFPVIPSKTVLSLKRGDTEHELPKRLQRKGVSALGVWLPAGEYQMGDWDSTKLGDYPAITVKAGHLTDMGQLVPVSLGGYEVVVLPVRNPEAAFGRAVVLEEFAGVLSAERVIEWNPTALPKAIEPKGFLMSPMSGLIADMINNYEREKARTSKIKKLRAASTIAELLQAAQAGTAPQTEAAVDAKSTLYFGAELGQIRTRQVNGEWGAIDTGSLSTVTAVEVHGTTLAAGLANGIIRTSKDGGATWTVAAAVERDEVISDIDRAGAYWMVTTRRMDHGKMNQAKVYAAAKEDFSDIAVIRTAPLEGIDFLLATNTLGETFGESYYWHAPGQLARLDTKTMQWETLKAPDNIKIFHVSPSTEMLTLYRVSGFPKQLYVSMDRGTTWKKIDTPTYVIHDIYFENPDKGHAVRSDTSKGRALYKQIEYNREKDSWNQTGTLPLECEGTLSDDKLVTRFCVLSGGSILHHANGKWAVEFSNE